MTSFSNSLCSLTHLTELILLTVKFGKKKKLTAGDKGYQGIHKIHANSRIPKKSKRGSQLT